MANITQLKRKAKILRLCSREFCRGTMLRDADGRAVCSQCARGPADPYQESTIWKD